MKRLLDDGALNDEARRLLDSAPRPRGPRSDELEALADTLAATGASAGNGAWLGGKFGGVYTVVGATVAPFAIFGAISLSGSTSEESTVEAPKIAVRSTEVGPEPVAPATGGVRRPAVPGARRNSTASTSPTSPTGDRTRPPPVVEIASNESPSTAPIGKAMATKAERPASRRRNARKVNASPPKRPPGEVQLIDRARVAFSDRPRDALSALALHARHYPNGVLADERDFLQVRAALSLQDIERALRARERLVRRAPKSPYLTRIDDLLRRQDGRTVGAR